MTERSDLVERNEFYCAWKQNCSDKNLNNKFRAVPLKRLVYEVGVSAFKETYFGKG